MTISGVSDKAVSYRLEPPLQNQPSSTFTGDYSDVLRVAETAKAGGYSFVFGGNGGIDTKIESNFRKALGID